MEVLTRAVPSRPSVLLVEDLLFMVDDVGVAACVEAKTGAERWCERIGGDYSSSPIHANGRIYFCSQEGKTTIIEAADKYRQVAVNELADGFMASPAVSGNALFLRTQKLSLPHRGTVRGDRWRIAAASDRTASSIDC